MPVEIKELVIRAVVEKGGPKAGGHGAASAEKAQGEGPEYREALVAAAVREVLRILKSSKER